MLNAGSFMILQKNGYSRRNGGDRMGRWLIQHLWQKKKKKMLNIMT